MGMEQKLVSPYEDKPNKDALIKQRERYVNLAVEELFSNENALDELHYHRPVKGKRTDKVYGASFHGDKGYEGVVEWIYDELKRRQGFDENTPKKDVDELISEYPRMVITNAIEAKIKKLESEAAE